MRVPIPSDWNGQDYCYHLVCWPNSPDWSGILLGLVTTISRGWFWDERTGSIVDIQSLAGQIIQQNTDTEGVILGCSDLTAVLQQIAAAIENIEASQVEIAISNNASASAQAEVNQSILNLSFAYATSQAWAESMAIATASVELENNVNITIGPVSPTQPPVAEQVAETGISTTPRLDSVYCDVAVYVADYSIAFVEALQGYVLHSVGISLTAVFGIVAETINMLKVLGLPVPVTSSPILAALSGKVYTWGLQGILADRLQDAVDALVDNRAELICIMYNGANSGLVTNLIRTAIRDYLGSQAISDDVVDFLMWLLHPTSMALLYYSSPLLTIPSTTEDCNYCTA